MKETHGKDSIHGKLWNGRWQEKAGMQKAQAKNVLEGRNLEA